MRKPDDDLKIDIADLFGGIITGPSEQLEEAAALEELPAGTPSASENEFQEWMSNRNAELEAKTIELGKKFQEPAPSETAPTDVLLGGELLSAPAEAEPAAAPSPTSPIDFNAPIAPPFMGTPSVPVPAAEADSNQSSEGKATSADAEELKRLQAEHEFLMLYDEFRNIIVYELKDLVGEKKTFTMLGRTVELAREKFPEVFRNANWDAAGNLLEDGSVDSQRLIENKNALDPQKAEGVLDTALSSLLKLRLQAVEKGLGTGLKNKVRAHLYQWISEKTQKAVREGKDAENLKRLSGYVAST